MAIHEHEKEDLLRDAHAMPNRGKCRLDDVELIVGFRSQGQASLYCDGDPVFQFNATGELRRVFFRGQKIAAEQAQLVTLSRDQRGGKVQFVAIPVKESLQTEVLESLAHWRKRLTETDVVDWQIIEEMPGKFSTALRSWLAMPRDAIADSPHA